MDDTGWKNYRRAFKCLQNTVEAINKEPQNYLYEMAMIQAFEFTSELALKTLRNYLVYQGCIAMNSTRDIIRQAFQAQIIVDGQTWIEMLEARNEISFAYDDKQLSKIVTRIRDDFYPVLIQLQIDFLNVFNADFIKN